MAKICEMVLPRIESHGAIEAWMIDDASFPSKGKHSTGVARQYCGSQCKYRATVMMQ
ncbi:MAG: transposase [Pseudolabrys sp.]